MVFLLYLSWQLSIEFHVPENTGASSHFIMYYAWEATLSKNAFVSHVYTALII